MSTRRTKYGTRTTFTMPKRHPNPNDVGLYSATGQLINDEPVENLVKNGPVNYTRDEDYYNEEGDIVLGVGNKLFRFHKQYVGMYWQALSKFPDTSLGEGGSPTEGSCDEFPRVIPGVRPSQFRNLLRMFYHPLPDDLFNDLHICKKQEGHSWDTFRYCADAAQLCHRFGMAHSEQWQRKALESIVYAGAGEVVREASAYAVDPSPLLDILRYSTMNCGTPMTRNIRNIIQCYAENTVNLALDERLVTLFRTPDLLKNDPSLYGFFFALLLRFEPTEWEKGLLTQKDRTALSSAQDHLVSFPPELMEGLDAPLFQEPTSPNTFFAKVWDGTTNEQCNEECRARTLSCWQFEFNELYYRDLTSTDFQPAILALTTIPSRRLRFAENIRARECLGNRNCSQAVLDILDRDIERVYAQVATYYQEIE